MKKKPDMSFWGLWNLSFGFFGVQIAYALQSANVSRIFSTIGADPHDLSYFWILPPLMGLIVQPFVGAFSDRTWNKLGRRLPYLIVGALVAILVMCLLPNAGSFHLTVANAILLGLIALMILDTSINMAMQPFKMLVGDMVNEKQKGLAYSIQSFLCNAGSVVGFVFPFLLAWFGVRNTAAAGVVPQTVVYSFYIGAAILLLCVVYSLMKIREWPPALYNEYNEVETASDDETKAKKQGVITLLRNAPSTFWTVGIVQFFCWFAFLFMWTYTTGTVAKNAFDAPTRTVIKGISYDENGKSQVINDKFILADNQLIVEHGKALAAGIEANGTFYPASTVVTVSGDTLLNNSLLFELDGVSAYEYNKPVPVASGKVVIAPADTVNASQVTLVSRLSRLSGETEFTLAAIVVTDRETGHMDVENSKAVFVDDASSCEFVRQVELNTESTEYNEAGNWVGVLFAVQAIGSVLWAVVLPMFRNRKFSYFLSLVLGVLVSSHQALSLILTCCSYRLC